MADGPAPDGSAGRDGRFSREWPEPARADGAPPVLDLGFDAGTLETVRAQLRRCVRPFGFPEGQVEDVVLAVHELAANAVCHGGGAGRLRIWNLAGALYCQVDDGDLPKDSPAAVNSLPCERGHGLWVVQQLADEMQALSGPAGTSILIRFDRGAARHFGQKHLGLASFTRQKRHERLTELVTAGTDVPGLVAACLRPPLYATRFGAGFGTLYTAEYRPAEGTARYHWPQHSWEHSLRHLGTDCMNVGLGPS